jgi:probable rRNA maturation factor
MLMAIDSQLVLDLEIQNAIHETGIAAQPGVPTQLEFHGWVVAALAPVNHRIGMVIRVVDEQESRQLNSRYRGKDKPTNVLSFPFSAPAGVDSNHLGDLVICAPVVKREAGEQQKKEIDHWAHMVVHGVLHLRGLDHQTEEQAREMEELEKQILAGLGIKDPYQLKDVSI